MWKIYKGAVAQSNSHHNLTEFPENFKFGVGVSSYQTEGAWNASGKGVHIWDVASHTIGKIVDSSTGDIACDSYHKYKEDIRLVAQLKVKYYRFSIAWTRLYPNGLTNNLNIDGVNYYNNLINGLLQSEIEPMVTLFHFDTPQYLQELGGWANDAMINWFEEYADTVFKMFGDRVKSWISFNEPYIYCYSGYGMIYAPFIENSGFGVYQCIHNMIKAHAKAYQLYKRKYKGIQKGVIGISLSFIWPTPADAKSESDHLAAQRAREFSFGSFLWPIFKTGDYPPSLRNRIDYLSYKQGFKHSRLPRFTDEDKLDILHSADFLGVNNYYRIVTKFDNQTISQTPTYRNDLNVKVISDPNIEQIVAGMYINRPDTLYEMMIWIDKELGREWKIIITENGYAMSAKDKFNDQESIDYMNSYLQGVLDVMAEGVNIVGYMWWSLLDNFEWTAGYTQKFGLYHTDFESANRSRTAKKIAMVYQNIIVTRKIDTSFNPKRFHH